MARPGYPAQAPLSGNGFEFDTGAFAPTTSGPRVVASLHNLVITILRLASADSIAAALRYHARRPSRPVQTIMKR